MDKEREAFEARYRPHWTDAMFRRSYDNDEDYADTDVDLMWQGWQARAALDNPAPQWLPIESAPRDDKPVLLYHKTHGEIRGWFAKGEWSTHYESGREYSGDAWVLGDDIEQVLVEQMPDGSWCDGEITHWMPLPQPPQGDTK